jgi:hypothetical protein
MNTVDQLWSFYEQESWHKKRISKEEHDSYVSKLLSLGNILTVSDGDVLLGYVEFWRIDFEQFGRIICGEHFSAYHENVQGGLIAYVANTFIRPEMRSTDVYKRLRTQFLRANSHCTHFVGEARRKKSEPVKVFKRSQLIKESIYGK